MDGDDTGAEFTVEAVTLISGAWGTGTAKAFLDYDGLTGRFKFNENFDRTTGGAASNVFRIKGWGRYNLQSAITDLLEPNINSFYIQSTGGSSTQDNSSAMDMTKLHFVTWEQYGQFAETGEGSFGRPTQFTFAPDGLMDLFPKPDQEYVIHLNYTAEPEELADTYSVTMTGMPADYQDIVVWMAVRDYAEYDHKAEMFAKANKKVEFYKSRLHRNQAPVMAFGPNLFESY